MGAATHRLPAGQAEAIVSVAVVVGNPKPQSRTYRAAHIAAEQLAGRPADLSIDPAEVGAALLDWSDAGVPSWSRPSRRVIWSSSRVRHTRRLIADC